MTLQRVIGERLLVLRGLSGLTRQHAADLAGCNRMLLYNYERGKYQPRLDLLQKILRVYGCSLSQFFAKWENGEPVA